MREHNCELIRIMKRQSSDIYRMPADRNKLCSCFLVAFSRRQVQLPLN